MAQQQNRGNKEKINEMEVRKIDIIQCEKQRNIYEKNKLSLENLWNYNKIANILDWRVQEGEEQGVRAEKVLDERFQIWQET